MTALSLLGTVPHCPQSDRAAQQPNKRLMLAARED
jgi:hypothetical protein